MRVVVALVVAVACACAATTQTARAAADVRFGIQDDAWLEAGPGKLHDRVAMIKGLGLSVVRVTLDWNETEPSQGDYDWSRADRLLGALQIEQNAWESPMYSPTTHTFPVSVGSTLAPK